MNTWVKSLEKNYYSLYLHYLKEVEFAENWRSVKWRWEVNRMTRLTSMQTPSSPPGNSTMWWAGDLTNKDWTLRCESVLTTWCYVMWSGSSCRCDINKITYDMRVNVHQICLYYQGWAQEGIKIQKMLPSLPPNAEWKPWVLEKRLCKYMLGKKDKIWSTDLPSRDRLIN